MINIPHTVILFIGNRKKGKVSKIPERWRECVCVRGRVVTRRGGVCHKNDRWGDGPFGIKIEGLF
jgi:hypothetical protein